MTDEATITINGVQLTTEQSCTMRVALESFATILQREGCGDDEHGRAMTQGYQNAIRGIREILYRTENEE